MMIPSLSILRFLTSNPPSRTGLDLSGMIGCGVLLACHSGSSAVVSFCSSWVGWHCGRKWDMGSSAFPDLTNSQIAGTTSIFEDLALTDQAEAGSTPITDIAYLVGYYMYLTDSGDRYHLGVASLGFNCFARGKDIVWGSVAGSQRLTSVEQIVNSTCISENFEIK
ncbi:hypothetical protein P152DRAFT_97215 [Eremomyces bilateralis CBS 781.70]|uniref:Uncharacterized protein n=1 Tax=Eremomyces bilateralis CBS 781.70 TaxID=1392243 RepID=A0A6G1FXK2_9PEZI|nr:uncharacterized protein P152DRAFT_97215 [Eremomyces bilateralis CBS 781.70]KAF1810396.1 hypothetical protein P152DRAFT_97215 [Eremomyces bilateralis CBS 781.70]